MSKLSERIKLRRQQLNLTLLYVAEELGVKEATVQRYESGEIKNIKHETISALAEILQCSPEYLMGWQDEIYASHISLSSDEKKLLEIYSLLNNEGKNKLIERAESLIDLGYSSKGDAATTTKYGTTKKII